MASLSKTSKMPGPSWGISADLCPTGSKLAKVPGTVCHECYAMRGRYHMPNVQDAQRVRMLEWHNYRGPVWVHRMAGRIEPHRWFRWFDSGDLQSEAMLRDIMTVCDRTPGTGHYLPTKEIEFVRAVVSRRDVPANLSIRLCGYRFDHLPPNWTQMRTFGMEQVGGSTVTSAGVEPLGQRCPAPDQGGKCQDCRACWDRTVPLVSYDRKPSYVGGKHRRRQP